MPADVFLPVRRADLLLTPAPDNGGILVRDPRTKAHYRLGAQEAFLLSRLDGQHTPENLRRTFETRFGEPLAAKDLEEFLGLARGQDLLQAEQPALADVAVEMRHQINSFTEHFAGSQAIYRPAGAVIAGASTHDRRGFGPFPVYVNRAEGARKWEVGGR